MTEITGQPEGRSLTFTTMSFQTYVDNIRTKTGKTPEDFTQLAPQKGLPQPGIKAGEITDWLRQDFDLGHGHAMAVYKFLKDSNLPGSDRVNPIK